MIIETGTAGIPLREIIIYMMIGKNILLLTEQKF